MIDHVDKVITHIDGLVQDCSNFNALAMAILQSGTKPSIYFILDTPGISSSDNQYVLNSLHIIRNFTGTPPHHDPRD